jgi:hypothetical protein
MTEQQRQRSREANKRWKAANREKVSAYGKRYRLEHPYDRAYWKRHYRENRDLINMRSLVRYHRMQAEALAHSDPLSPKQKQYAMRAAQLIAELHRLVAERNKRKAGR